MSDWLAFDDLPSGPCTTCGVLVAKALRGSERMNVRPAAMTLAAVQELEDQLDRQKLPGAVGLSVGIPLIGLGVLLLVAGGKRKQSLKRVSVSAGQLQWRF